MSHAASTARPKDLMRAWNAVGLPLDDGQLPRGIGEWTADNGRLSYRFKLSWPPRAAVRRPWST